jgi:hypothetical protein
MGIRCVSLMFMLLHLFNLFHLTPRHMQIQACRYMHMWMGKQVHMWMGKQVHPQTGNTNRQRSACVSGQMVSGHGKAG